MNQRPWRQLIASLNVAGSPHKSTENPRPSKLSRGEWKKALEWLDEAGLTLIYWKRLIETGEERLPPPEIRACLERNLEDHRLRIAQMVSEFDSINRSFESAEIPYAVLKGFALIPEYCSDIFLRITYDYDYLVAPESVSCAERALKEAGYVRKERAEDHPLVFFHNARLPRSPSGRDDLYSAAFPRTIELHYLFWDSRPLKIPLLLPENPLARIGLRNLMTHTPGQPPGQPVQFYALSEEDELLFQVLHVFRHILRNWCRLSSLWDIAYFLDHRAFDAAFWDRFLERLRASRQLPEIAGVVFSLAAGVFGATIPDAISDGITQRLRSPLILWVKQYGLDSALTNFSDNKFSLFLHREFLHDKTAWHGIRQTRLFPIHRPSHAFQTASRALSFQALAGWRQGLYVAQRLKHHLLAGVRYGLESPRWDRLRSRER